MNKQRFYRLILIVSMLLSTLTGQAQGTKKLVNWRDARITNVGVYMSDVEFKVTENTKTRRLDTTIVDNSRIVWQSEGADIVNIENNDFYKKGETLEDIKPNTGDKQVDSLITATRKKMRKVQSHYQKGNYADILFQDFNYYVFTFDYPSIDAEGKPVMLSAIGACPVPGIASRVNNIVLGTHITITADSQRPSARINNFGADDWGMLLSLAADNKMDYGAPGYFLKTIAWGGITIASLGTLSLVALNNLIQSFRNINSNTNYNNNLVIMPDYEGYGLTKGRAHPYLYQELTARQSVDALMYGKALYEGSYVLENIRLPIRSNYRTMSCGYSQGGSVAMACHRFIEQNGLEKTLHFTGSACGDGPYDPVATLMYYVKQCEDGDAMNMAVVLPLIMKGMLDCNPYMKSHKATDYFNPKFLATGIMDWLASKDFSTDDIAKKFYQCLKDNPSYYGDLFQRVGDQEKATAKLNNIMTPECYNHFKQVYNANKDHYNTTGVPLPTKRGVFEDLHFALASNDLTRGWKPKGRIFLYHSPTDPVVPYVNAERVKNTFTGQNGHGDDFVSLDDGTGDHEEAGMAFFSRPSKLNVVVLDEMKFFEYINDLAESDYE